MTRLVQRYSGTLQLLFVIAVVGSAVMLSASLQPDDRPTRPKAVSDRVAVTVVAPAPATYTPTISLNGVVQSRAVTSVIPEVSGRVVDVSPSFRPGARVNRGDRLFAIDPADYELAIDRTLAEIEIARAELARLEAEAAAEREVWNNTFPDRPIPDLIARKPQIAAARARIHSGEAARAAAELDLARTVVRAPFDARILETQLDVGQVVGSNAAVGSMFSEASIEIAVPVSADELQRIGPVDGRKASISTPGGETVAGTVVRKAASLDERTRLGTLFIASDSTGPLTLGEFVAVEMEGLTAAAAYRVPPAAMTSRDRLWVVEDEQLAERRVRLLGRDGETLVVDAFDIADGVVAVPPSEVRDGLPVQPVSSPEFAANGAVAGAAK